MQEQEQIIRITGKLQELLRKHETLIKENDRLRKENTELSSRHELHVGRIADLEQTVSVLRTLTGNMEDQDKKALEKQLNAYIREIDRCIALLGE